MDLNGKVALVTGGSGDIGKAIGKALAASGANIAVSYVGESARAGELLRWCEALAGSATPYNSTNESPNRSTGALKM
jgi:NAD(P)-dependent dehydrogenase (short-subunit alcohol dehydrogenase family)